MIADRRSRALACPDLFCGMFGASTYERFCTELHTNGEADRHLRQLTVEESRITRGCLRLEPDFMEVCKAAWLRY